MSTTNARDSCIAELDSEGDDAEIDMTLEGRIYRWLVASNIDVIH
jgi:hypothetical protein